MNTFSRDRLFREFHKQTGIKPFSPEFIDSLVAVMRDPDSCLAEQVFAWAKWRSWGNSSTYAVSDWNPATAWRLDQTDCALDLAWFQEGRPLEWVEGMTKEYRLQIRDKSHPDRPKTVLSKQWISEAFTKNDDRGTITFDGQGIFPVVSPQQNTLQKYGTPRTFEKDPTFLEFWKVVCATDFEQWQSSCAAYNQARKVARAAYRAYRKHRTSEPPILIPVKELLSTDSNNSLAGGRAIPVVSEPHAEEEPPARPPEESNYTRRRQGAPLWHDRLAKFLEALPIGTRLDTTMHIQIRDTLSEELLDQFETACKSANGIRKWSGYLGIAKQVAARGVVKVMAANANGKPETDFERRYREEIERRRREEQVSG